MRYLQRYDKTPAELAEILRPFGVTGFIISNSKTSVKAFCSCGKDIKSKEVGKCPHCGGRIETFNSAWARGTKRSGQTYALVETPDKLKLMSHKISFTLSSDEVEVIIEATTKELFTICKNASSPIGVTFHNNCTGWELETWPALSQSMFQKVMSFAPQLALTNYSYVIPTDLKIALQMQIDYSTAFSQENMEKYPQTVSKMANYFQKRDFVSANNTSKYSDGDPLDKNETIEGIAYTLGIPFELKDLDRVFEQMAYIGKICITSKFERFLTTISGSIMLNRFNHHSSDFMSILKVLEFYNRCKDKKEEYEFNVFEQFLKEHVDIYEGSVVNKFEERREFLKKEGIPLTVDNVRNRNYFARVNGNAYKVLGSKTIQELMDGDPLDFITSIRR